MHNPIEAFTVWVHCDKCNAEHSVRVEKQGEGVDTGISTVFTYAGRVPPCNMLIDVQFTQLEGGAMQDQVDETVESVRLPAPFGPHTTRQGEPPWEDVASTEPDAGIVLVNVLERMAQSVLDDRTQTTTPPVVTLCGSTRFRDHFEAAERAFTRKGIIVLTVGGYWSRSEGSLEAAIGDEDAAKVYMLHLDKIGMSDAVVLLDVGGYEGDTTRTERLFAESLGVDVLSYNTWSTATPPPQDGAAEQHEHVWMRDEARQQFLCQKKTCDALVTEEEVLQAPRHPETGSVEDEVAFLNAIWARKQAEQ